MYNSYLTIFMMEKNILNYVEKCCIEVKSYYKVSYILVETNISLTKI